MTEASEPSEASEAGEDDPALGGRPVLAAERRRAVELLLTLGPRAGCVNLHGPLLPRNPRLADWLLAQALAHRSGGDPPELEPLPDELEARARAVSAERARARGGRST